MWPYRGDAIQTFGQRSPTVEGARWHRHPVAPIFAWTASWWSRDHRYLRVKLSVPFVETRLAAPIPPPAAQRAARSD
jgi:hypothetical protein